MKKKKIKKIIKKNLLLFLMGFFIIGTAFGSYTSYLISIQSSTVVGSNNNLISFSGGVDSGYYNNDENNSSILGNYLTGYYYDSVFGFFKLDWSSNNDENVRIIGSTNICPSGYGYKLGGKAYSIVSGYIDFNYNLSTFVYYCIDDLKLYGKAYGKYIGYQNFDGISIANVTITNLLEKVVNNTIFINDTSNIEKSTTLTAKEIKILGGDLIQINPKKESLFYIIK